ncbi:hypothetical protein M23134_04316 [Microscilla marina ATCC 23134]|uniref:Uncharacterized protein n=1 Tax=Microscilla marina ATCC 23134 TaxID=313606 RepID=A1ZEH5_MICM2|nr:hypothetical protein M23134_04316 [Microscilla marina ATCC 23134]
MVRAKEAHSLSGTKKRNPKSKLSKANQDEKITSKTRKYFLSIL